MGEVTALNEMRKILVMDDDDQVLEDLSSSLSTSRVAVIKCSDITQAEYALKHTFLDAVIADLRLTGVNGPEGLEFLPYVKQHSPATKVVIIAAAGSPLTEREAYEKGAYFFTDKPVNFRLLRERLAALGIYH